MSVSVFHRWLAAVAALCCFAASAAAQAANQPASSSATAKAKTPAAKASSPATPNPKAIGMQSAPIVMEVFSDYECPACRELYLNTLRQVIENYVISGRVYLIHRDMPLRGHKYSRLAARYANAAAKLNKLQRVVEVLYLTQEKWVADGNVDGAVATVLSPAELQKVRSLVQSGSVDASIDGDVQLGTRRRVNQTPTMFITHKGQQYPIVGVMSYSVLKRFLDELLKQ